MAHFIFQMPLQLITMKTGFIYSNLFFVCFVFKKCLENKGEMLLNRSFRDSGPSVFSTAALNPTMAREIEKAL